MTGTLAMSHAAPPDPNLWTIIKDSPEKVIGLVTAIGAMIVGVHKLLKFALVDRLKERNAERRADEKEEFGILKGTVELLDRQNKRLEGKVETLEKRLEALDQKYAMQMAAKDQVIAEKDEKIAHLEAELQNQILINDGAVKTTQKLIALLEEYGIPVPEGLRL